MECLGRAAAYKHIRRREAAQGISTQGPIYSLRLEEVKCQTILMLITEDVIGSLPKTRELVHLESLIVICLWVAAENM